MDALTAEPLIQATSQPRRLAPIRMLEMVVVALAIATPVATFLFVRNFAHQVFNPGVAASLLLANLLPYVALIVLIGRRIAIHRATRSALAGGGRLHVRLVAVFTLMASIPIVLTVIAASVMFQSGVQLWGSERARGAFDATTDLAKEGRGLVAQRWATEARTMVDDLTELFPKIPANSSAFQRKLLEQLYYRSFDQAVVFRVVDGKQVEAMYTWEAPPAKIFAARVSGQVLNLLRDEQSYTNFDAEKQWVVTPLDRSRNIFLYVANSVNVGFMNRQNSGADRIVAEFNALQARSRSLQLQFNAVLFGVALLIVSIATWIALAVADRLVQPVEQLVIAARRVAGGDLAARVDIPQTGDEISTLGNAFNGMTERLEHQTGELRTANAQLESRRMLIEAVMSGVSAGVISIDAQRKLRLINESAIELLRPGEQELVGHPLRELAPELDTLLDSGDREAVIQLGTGGDARTLAVKVTSDEAGRVLTFDDITQQLNDQRRAAWSDVARRIAHEIKNPLTPIQLAAERLKRRYGKKIEPEDGTFAQLTDTIVRQVGDLRRMVDEFSSFARMPKPVFRQESLLDIARQAMFLHEVAHPTIRFEMNAPDPAPGLICDRRQIGQAFTNIVKNAVEAIEARGEGEALPRGEIVMTIDPEAGGRIALTLADNGIGLPVERDRIVEPYMTTRSRGTGLGLAIVKKIVEEHFGTIAFSDRPGGGTLVTICFDTDQLAEMASTPEGEGGEEPRPAVLTRSGSAKS
ncbi:MULTISPECIES: ATP-binding protein [unclassified Sphingomonas]|uniref:sensor histidine kinase NtrY-like n=1 Tax=Sphingomonas TaxID=13687 RepID=UPI0009626523|nr:MULTISPECIES: ATP-binding protein [unclassified Sphingomonas]MBN8813242.1 HAMP domain-containing protein [Sphingomonas sp.]OJY53435.1 MAG: PAS domain-containing sensor histidine kinase [Sphingomonas sp. 67-41]